MNVGRSLVKLTLGSTVLLGSLAFPPLLAGEGITWGTFLATALASVAAGNTANAIDELIEPQNSDRVSLQHQDVTRAVGKAIAVIITLAAKQQRWDPGRKLEKIAAQAKDNWVKIFQQELTQQRYPELKEGKLNQFLTPKEYSLTQAGNLTVEEWKDIFIRLNMAACKGGGFQLGSDIYQQVAELLYTNFPKALQETLKEDFARDGKAFAGLTLQLLAGMKAELAELRNDVTANAALLSANPDLELNPAQLSQIIDCFQHLATQLNGTEIQQQAIFTQISRKIDSGFAQVCDRLGVVETNITGLLQYLEETLESLRQEVAKIKAQQGGRQLSSLEFGNLLAAVDQTNELYLSQVKKIKIAGKTIPRTETEEALEKLRSSQEKNSVLLVGAAGIGKSGVMLQVIEALKQQGMPLIAFRVDRLSPAYHPDQVGEQLKLPASPATVLANIADDRDSVLVIDQLDAVSLASGRHPDFFDCIDRIIQQTKAHPKMRVLLACRKFDLENDHRIKRLVEKEGIAATVPINPLNPKIVKEVVTKYIGLKVSQFTEKQLKLLSIPLHLVLLAELAPSFNIDIDRFDFQTVNDLYDQFWEEKQKFIKQRLNRSVQWTEVIDALCEYMSTKQRLSAPKSILDEWKRDADEMASEHILLFDGKKYSFFHEDFFDYAFARRFAAQGKDLLAFLRSAEQHLFRRTQVRQILLYEREPDFEQYLDDLKELLTSDDIRFHIKQVVFSVLATFNEPREEEWEIIEPLIAHPSDPLTDQVYWVLRDSEAWFILLDSLGAIENWLKNDQNEELVRQAIFILASIESNHSERVTELLQPYVGVSETWLNRLRIFIRGIKLGKNRSTFDLFLALIQTGLYDRVAEAPDDTRGFWDDIYNFPKQNSDWFCEAIAVYLTKKLRFSIQAGQSNPFEYQTGIFYREGFNARVLIESAENSPGAFANNLLPFMEEVLKVTAYNEGDPPWYDRVWQFRSYDAQEINQLDQYLLFCMEKSLWNLAKNTPDDCHQTLNTLKTSKFETFHYLLMRAYTANGELFADEAIDYLCQHPRQLQTGYGNSWAAHSWTTRELIEAVTPHCSNDCLEKLENLLLDYYPQSKEQCKNNLKDFLKWRGYAQFVLLDAIAPNRRSPKIKRRWQEWQRKFISVSQKFPGRNLVDRLGKIPSPQPTIVGFVGSPVPEKAGDKMSDRQWLQAITDYNDVTNWEEHNGQLVGGARELASQSLQPQVKKEPIRFARLVKQFPDTANSMYFDAVLRGIAETDSEIDIETAWMVCQRCDKLPKKPCGRAISWLFSKWPKLLWPDEAFDLLIWYAMEHPDPDRELWKTETSNGQYYYGGDVLLAGINSVRGSAVRAIASLIFADRDRANYFQPILDKMVQDPSIAVRACVAEVLTAWLNHDQDRAVKLFQQLCNTSEDSFLGTRTVEDFLSYTLKNYFDDLTPIVQRMIDSDLPGAIAGGTRQICIAALSSEEAHPLAENCLSGTATHRQAAASIFSENIRLSSCRDFSETALIQLFNDRDADVRSDAARCFDHFEESELGNYTNLIERFVESPAFDNNFRGLLYALQKTTAKLPDVTYLICKSYVQRLEPSDLAFLGSTDIVSELVIRLYSQTRTRKPKLQSPCLDLIDTLSEMNIYSLEKRLKLYEDRKI